MAVLSYDFRVAGMSTVNRAFASLERRVARFNTRTKRMFAQGGGGAITGGRGSAAMSEQRAHQRRRGQIQKEGMARRAALAKSGAAESRAGDRAHQRRMGQIRKEGAAKRREISRASAKEQRDLTRIYRQTLKERAGRGVARRRLVGGAARGAAGAVGGVARMGLGALAIGGGFAFGGAVRNEVQVQKAASQLAVKAFATPGETRSRKEIRSKVMGQARGLGATTGLGALGVIESLRQMTAITGNLPQAQKMAPFMADIADATGAQIGDVGRTAGQIAMSIGTRPGMTQEEQLSETTAIMAEMTQQAKVGSIEFEDLATQMGAIMSATAGFEGKVSELASTMGAVAQLSIAGAAKSPEQAMTAIMNFQADLISNAERFNRMDVDVWRQGATGKEMKAPEEVLYDILEKTGGDLTMISKGFGRRAKKAVQPFTTTYFKAGGGEAGLAAVKKLLASRKGAKGTEAAVEEIKESAIFRRQEADKQFAMSLEKFNAAIGTELLPTLTELVPKFNEMIPALTTVASTLAEIGAWTIENPFLGLGALFAAYFGKEMVAGMLAGEMGRLPGIIGGALTGATIGVAMATFQVKTAIYEAKEKVKAAEAKRQALLKTGYAEISAGKQTPEIRKRLQRSMAEARKEGIANAAAGKEVSEEGYLMGAVRWGATNLAKLGIGDPEGEYTLGAGALAREKWARGAQTKGQAGEMEWLLEMGAKVNATNDALATLKDSADKAGKALGAVGQPGRGDKPTTPD